MSTAKSPTPREQYELKQQAIRYYQDNGVPQKFEEILNSMFYENPDDVYGHLANYFDAFSKASVISKIKAHEVFDSKGQPTLQTNIYCTIRNHEKLVCSEVGSSFNVVPEHWSAEEKEEEDATRQADVTAAIAHIHGPITDGLTGIEPTSQEEADGIICGILKKMQADAEEQAKETAADAESPQESSPTPRPTESPVSKGKAKSAGKSKGKGPPVVVIPDEPLEKFHPGSNAVSNVSAAFCQAGAITAEQPLYRHVAQLRHGEMPTDLCLPCPMVTIVSSGRTAPGKSNCVKDYMVIPKPGMPVRESVKHIMAIYNCVSKNMSLRGGSAKGKKGGSEPAPSKLTNDLGALVPTLDRPEQGIELIQDAITQIGLTPGEDFHIALNCAGQEVFDHEKGKYEVVVGLQKDGEGMVEFWADLISRFPAVIALIDPMRKQDKESWMQLCEKISEQCYVIGDFVYHRPGLLKDEELTPDFKTSGIVLRMEQMNTVTDVLQAAKKMEDAANQVVISSSLGDTNSHLVVDLAVGTNARFLITGAPARGERIAKLNRLIEIETELQENGCLLTVGEHTFPIVKPPTPPPEEEPNPETANDGAESEKN